MPVSPYPSCLDPTKIVMLTVTFGCDTSGINRTRRPFASRYSVMPSTVVTFVTPAGGCAKAGKADATRTTREARKTRQTGRRDGIDYSFCAGGGASPADEVMVGPGARSFKFQVRKSG